MKVLFPTKFHKAQEGDSNVIVLVNKQTSMKPLLEYSSRNLSTEAFVPDERLKYINRCTGNLRGANVCSVIIANYGKETANIFPNLAEMHYELQAPVAEVQSTNHYTWRI